MSESTPLDGTTRREIIRRGGLFAGAIALGSWSFGNGTAHATARAALAPARQGAFTALAEIVVTGPGLRLGPDAVRQTVAQFESAYARWPAVDRARANTVLDALSHEFSGRSPAARAAALTPSATNPRAAQLAYDARNLMALALGADDDQRCPAEVPV